MTDELAISAQPADSRDEEYGLAELLSKDIPPLHWAVDGLIPTGLTLVVGKPKLGKSLLVLNLCISVSCAGMALGKIAVEESGVLYLALEDGWRRLQTRALRMLEGQPGASDRLRLRLRWPRLDQGGLELLDEWVRAHPSVRVVAIDTLQRVRPISHGRQAYAEDHASLEGLHELAHTHGVAIIVVHHARKGAAEDPLDAVSGTTGLTAVADGILVLERQRSEQEAVLHVEQRDGEEGMKDLALTFDQRFARWELAGDAREFALAKWEQETVEILRSSAEPLRAGEIAELMDLESATVKMRLHRLLKDGKVRLVKRGLYAPATQPEDLLHAPVVRPYWDDGDDALF